MDKKWQNIYLAAKTNCQKKSNNTIHLNVFSKENIITLVHLFTLLFILKLLKEKVTPESEFFLSSPIKSLYWVKLISEVSASKVHAIPRN